MVDVASVGWTGVEVEAGTLGVAVDSVSQGVVDSVGYEGIELVSVGYEGVVVASVGCTGVEVEAGTLGVAVDSVSQGVVDSVGYEGIELVSVGYEGVELVPVECTGLVECLVECTGVELAGTELEAGTLGVAVDSVSQGVVES